MVTYLVQIDGVTHVGEIRNDLGLSTHTICGMWWRPSERRNQGHVDCMACIALQEPDAEA